MSLIEYEMGDKCENCNGYGVVYLDNRASIEQVFKYAKTNSFYIKADDVKNKLYCIVCNQTGKAYKHVIKLEGE